MATAPKRAQALDLALIGNCRVAALVNREARIVWWCFPAFDSDPVFSRLLAGNEEKGFCDVVMANREGLRVSVCRNTAIVETVMTDEYGRKVKHHRFRAAFRAIRAHLPAAATGPPDRTDRGNAEDRDPRSPDRQLRRGTSTRPSSAPIISAITARRGCSPDNRCAAFLHRQRSDFPGHRPISLFFGPDDPLRSAIDTQPGISRSHPRALDQMGAQSRGSPRMAGRRDPRRHYFETLQLRGDRRASSPRITTSIPEAPINGAQLGLSLLLDA